MDILLTDGELNSAIRIVPLRGEVLRRIEAQPDRALQSEGAQHLNGVSNMCRLLALRRGLDASLAAAAGLLHDIATFTTGDSSEHGKHGAKLAAEILRSLGLYADDEIDSICAAIRAHSDKNRVGEPLDEALKDADLLDYYLRNPSAAIDGHLSQPYKRVRIEASLAALGI